MSRGYTGWDVLDPTSPVLQPRAKRHKYGAKATEFLGVRFDSRREAVRYQELLIRGQAGELCDLELQPSFPIVVNGVKVCTYRADFGYRELATNQIVTEDSKGWRTPVYRLKKKLVEAQYGIQIVEV
jgi:hypothetical protein